MPRALSEGFMTVDCVGDVPYRTGLTVSAPLGRGFPGQTCNALENAIGYVRHSPELAAALQCCIALCIATGHSTPDNPFARMLYRKTGSISI